MGALETMWEMQRILNYKCGVNPTTFEKDDIVKWVEKFLRALNQEEAELMDSLPWKHWRPQGAQEFDIQNARVELVDMFHFLMSIGQVLGMTAESFTRIYMEKNKVNHERQDSGYFVKDEDDCKGIV